MPLRHIGGRHITVALRNITFPCDAVAGLYLTTQCSTCAAPYPPANTLHRCTPRYITITVHYETMPELHVTLLDSTSPIHDLTARYLTLRYRSDTITVLYSAIQHLYTAEHHIT